MGWEYIVFIERIELLIRRLTKYTRYRESTATAIEV